LTYYKLTASTTLQWFIQQSIPVTSTNTIFQSTSNTFSRQ